MSFDFPHMIASAVIIFAVLWVVDHAGAFQDASRGRRTFYKFIGIFVPLFILNIVWPYGGSI